MPSTCPSTLYHNFPFAITFSFVLSPLFRTAVYRKKRYRFSAINGISRVLIVIQFRLLHFHSLVQYTVIILTLRISRSCLMHSVFRALKISTWIVMNADTRVFSPRSAVVPFFAWLCICVQRGRKSETWFPLWARYRASLLCANILYTVQTIFIYPKCIQCKIEINKEEITYCRWCIHSCDSIIPNFGDRMRVTARHFG